MGFRFHQRINIGGGLGFNISKSGISPSVRTRFGSFGPKGISLRTGIPGLTYRSSGKKGSFWETVLIGMLVGVTIVVLWTAIRLAFTLLLYLLNIVIFIVVAVVESIAYLLGFRKEEPASEAAPALASSAELALSAEDVELHSAFSNFSTSFMDLAAQIAEPAHWEGFKKDTETRPWEETIRLGIRVELLYIGRFITHDGPLRGSGVKDVAFLMLLNKLDSPVEELSFDLNTLSKALQKMESEGAFRSHLAKLGARPEDDAADEHTLKLTFLPVMHQVKHQLLDQYRTHLNRLVFLLLQEDGAIPLVQKDKFMTFRKRLYKEENSEEKT